MVRRNQGAVSSHSFAKALPAALKLLSKPHSESRARRILRPPQDRAALGSSELNGAICTDGAKAALMVSVERCFALLVECRGINFDRLHQTSRNQSVLTRLPLEILAKLRMRNGNHCACTLGNRLALKIDHTEFRDHVHHV